MSWLMIALRNILRDSKRVISTVLIIAVGLTALLLGGGFMLATYDALQEIAMRSEGHVIVLDDSKTDVGGTHQQLTLADWQEIQDALWTDERGHNILPRARFEGLVSNGAAAAMFSGTGIDPKEEFRVWGPFLNTPKGELIDPWLTADELPQIMLGDQLAQTLTAEINDILTLHSVRPDGQMATLQVRLSGLIHTGTKELDDHSLSASIDAVHTLLGTDKISQLSIYLEDPQDTQAMKQQLQNQFDGIEVQSWQQRAELHDKVKALYDRIFSVMGVIILAVVFLAISNTVALAIYQRRDEIATFGALGTTTARICTNFILEALLVGLIAVLTGMALGYAIANAINLADLWMPAPPGRSEGHPLYIYISLPHYLATAAILIVTTVIAASAATYRATRINIAEALS